MTAALLLVLLAAEGLTILRIHSLLTPHVVIGMVLVPVVILKIGSTTWRFARYYLGDPKYRRKGAPHLLLRLLGPFVVVLTVAVLGTGIALLFSPTTGRSQWLFLHKATFVLWFGAMTLHVLGHLLDTARLAPRDFYRRTRVQVHGASVRQWFIVSALAVGGIMAFAVAPKIGPWRMIVPPSRLHSSSTPRLPPPATVRADVTPDLCPTALRTPQQVPGSTGWVPIGRLVSGCSSLYATHVGTVSVVWMDPRLLSFTLYSGSLIPGGGPYIHTAPITEADALNLVAGFNSGFKDGDSHGGYFVEGRAEVPLVNGIASAVIYADGTMRIGTWGTELSMTPDVVSVRQNMTLLIDNGVINPATSFEPYSSWGITWPGGATTNRAALGVTAQGAELFAGGVGLTVPQITQAIASAGAVRAMELDANDIYPNFSIFTPALNAPASALNGTEVVPGFSGPERYFTASWNRDFFAAFARPPAPRTQHRQPRG